MEKINIAELLKDCPEGMELDSPVWNNIVFEEIDEDNIVIFRKSVDAKVYLTQYGEVNSIDGKCIIFPKGKTTWEGFHRPFKDGDILATDLGSVFYLNTRLTDDERYGCYVGICCDSSFRICEFFAYKECCRFATEEEKEKLFKAIKDNGYKWNPEAEVLEKLIEPKFKVGDKVRHKTTNKDDVYEISKVYDDSYGLVGFTWIIYMKYQDYYELVPGKFEINTLVPFESRVLVRNVDGDLWKPAIYGFSTSKGCYVVGGVYWSQRIPYEGNEHLLGKTDDCNEYFKTWK